MTITLTKIPLSADLRTISQDLRDRFAAGQFAAVPPDARAVLVEHARALMPFADEAEALEWAVANPEPAEAAVVRLDSYRRRPSWRGWLGLGPEVA